ncbi:MAG TPA: PKD domain-containing protein [Flavobacteriales bacterium]|nr:PKD domain-containing protein [Flavobacteriales bacterium]
MNCGKHSLLPYVLVKQPNMNKTSILILGILVASVGIANQAFAQRTCGTDAAWAQVVAENPKYATSRIALEQSIQQWIQANPGGNSASKVVYTIPTVVHVVYNNSTQNISDAQVLSQIDVLNEDYRRTNADASNTPSWFQNVAADCEIEFCLAQQDPNGNASNGITRTSTSTSSFSGNGNVKSSSSGGKDAWPRNDYLNIWVCPLSGGLLGYALFPGGPASTDGVVIGYNYFGDMGTVSSPFNKGRTTTHEVGHWLSLYHSFDGGCAGTSSSNCATNGDRCCDTPPTSSSNGGCPSNNQNTCTETPTDQNDMHMNYMDYVNDACMNLFTLDQKARMVAVMTGARASLQFSSGCVNPTSNALDAGISAIVAPTGTSCATSISPVVTIENFGLNTLTTATINYDVDGGPNNTYSWTGSLTNGQSEDVTLPSMTISAGTHTFNSNTTSPNGGTDQDGSNDASSTSFTISGSSGAPLPFTEGFEGTTFPPSGWVLDNPESNATFSRVTTASGFGNSTASAQMNFYSPTEDISGQSDRLYTVDVDLSGASSPTVMDFNLAYTRYAAGNEDSLIIWVSTDCGATWNREWQDGGTSMQTSADNTNAFTPTASEWSAETVNLDTYNGFGVVQIQFHAYSGWGNNLYLDDINIHTGGGGGSAPVADFTSSSTSICEGATVSFTDQSTNTPTSWSWTFAGGSPGSSTAQNPSVTYNTAGNYAVTLTATNSSGSDTKTLTTYITVNASPSGNMSSTNAGCGTCDGTATAAGTGGSSPYTYTWSTSPQQNGATASNLCAGSYAVTIVDGNGCSGTASTTVSSTGGVTSTATSTDAGCGGCAGTGTASGSGGTAPYTYVWNTTPVQNSSTATGLCAGTYVVTTTDANGCSATSSVTVSGGAAVPVSAVGSDATCAGGCDGAASANVTGGTAPFTYYWNSSPVQTGATATGLCAGTYGVNVTDAEGCVGGTSVTISEPAPMIISATGSDASCGSSDGSATASTTNGTAPYNYLWSDGQTSSIAVGLSAGVYNVTVVDNNGCSQSTSVSVNNIGAPSTSTTSTGVDCYGGSNGTATVTATGGVSPYIYLWSNAGASSGSSVSGLSAGTYSVIVTDAAGCIATEIIMITEPTPIAITLSYSVVSSGTACDGSATANASGGVGPYTYQWNDPSNQTSMTATGLCMGSAGVTITDNNGCTSVSSIYVDSVVMSVHEILLDMDMVVYPNPTTGEVKISFTNTRDKELTIMVFDLSGKLIIEDVLERYQADVYTMDLSQYKNGIYFVRVIEDNSYVVTKKISLIR